MLVKRGRGNFNPKERKDSEAKSRTYSFRLNPAIPGEKWLIDEIERIGKNKLREVLPHWAMASGQYQQEPPPSEYYAQSMEEMKTILYQLAERIENGVLVQKKTSKKKVGETQFSKKTVDVLMGFMNEGVEYEEGDDE
jgi:hypothetical protein